MKKKNGKMTMSLETVNEDDECRTCHNTYGWHLEHKPIHPFNSGQAGATAFLGERDRDGKKSSQRDAQNAQTVVWPTDPVLRVALINKGLLTSDDFRAAEELLRSSMNLPTEQR